ncbi:hypothetical protein CSOJ01_05036 [Colletotrichum sojae]|uniref:Uncharacterized protein n=1 Tax=Colletotrichum sojae TaxID=2175907 RepID=A0A8H6JGP0_9PEZI|nr:hypothetical protein CSOJ01_05036 [Colletotrichum sojae]
MAGRNAAGALTGPPAGSAQRKQVLYPGQIEVLVLLYLPHSAIVAFDELSLASPVLFLCVAPALSISSATGPRSRRNDLLTLRATAPLALLDTPPDSSSNFAPPPTTSASPHPACDRQRCRCCRCLLLADVPTHLPSQA